MHTVRQDEHGWTHIDWTLDNVTPDMIDWHWSHMDKDYNLWHPAQHKDFSWVVPPRRTGSWAPFTPRPRPVRTAASKSPSCAMTTSPS